MIIDFHAHIFPRFFRDGRERFFPDEPAFELLYKHPKSRLAGAADILAAMDADKVDKSVVCGFPWQDPDLSKRHNDYILEAMANHPGRLIGFACVNIYDPDAVPEAERCLDAGMSGIGELAFYRTGMDEGVLSRLDSIMALARARHVPVLIHVNEPVGHSYPGKAPMTLAQIWSLVTRFPENALVLAHWGGGILFFNLLKREAKQALRNVYFDTAASPYLYDARIYSMAFQIFSPEKILFGSDFPLLSASRYFKEIREAGLCPQHAEALLGRNAARLLGIS